MTLLEKMKKNAAERRFAKCTIFGEEVLCRVHSKASIAVVQEQFMSDDTSVREDALIDQFLDIETKKPVLTREFIIEDCSQKDAANLIDLFMKLNGFDNDAVESAEKN